MVLFAGIKVSASDEPLAPGTNEFYAKRVVPILQNNCLKCHDDTAKGGLQLDSYSLIRKGGQDGPVIVPGDLEASMLIQAIRRSDDLKMPPKYALKDTEVADLEAWVKAGAVGADLPPQTSTVSAKDSSNSSQDAAPASAASPTLKNVSVGVDTDFFENKVRPIFANNCYECHTDQASGGMRLDSKAAFDQGGGRGPLIVPGNSDKSLLIQAVKQTGTLKMPRGGKLSERGSRHPRSVGAKGCALAVHFFCDYHVDHRQNRCNHRKAASVLVVSATSRRTASRSPGCASGSLAAHRHRPTSSWPVCIHPALRQCPRLIAAR